MRSLRVQILGAGAILPVHVGISGPRRKVFQRQGRPEPHPVNVELLIDTGASMTLLDEQLMRSLGLTPTGSTQWHSSSTNGVAQRCGVYDVRLVLGGIGTPDTFTVDPLQVIAPPFINHGYQGLLGRDVLSRVQLGWNGPTNSLTISYP